MVLVVGVSMMLLAVGHGFPGFTEHWEDLPEYLGGIILTATGWALLPELGSHD